MTDEEVEKLALELVGYLKKRTRENSFVPLSQMRGVFAHLDFNWRKHVQDLGDRIIMLDLVAVKAALKDEDERIVHEFHAQYFHSVMERYTEMFLDTVFYKEVSHESTGRILDATFEKATDADFGRCQTNK